MVLRSLCEIQVYSYRTALSSLEEPASLKCAACGKRYAMCIL